MIADPLPTFVTAIPLTIAVGVASARPHLALSAIMATKIAVDRCLKAIASTISASATASLSALLVDISAQLAPADPTATVKSP